MKPFKEKQFCICFQTMGGKQVNLAKIFHREKTESHLREWDIEEEGENNEEKQSWPRFIARDKQGEKHL